MWTSKLVEKMRKQKLTQVSIEEHSDELADIGAILAESIFCTNLLIHNFHAIFVQIRIYKISSCFIFHKFVGKNF